MECVVWCLATHEEAKLGYEGQGSAYRGVWLHMNKSSWRVKALEVCSGVLDST